MTGMTMVVTKMKPLIDVTVANIRMAKVMNSDKELNTRTEMRIHGEYFFMAMQDTICLTTPRRNMTEQTAMQPRR